jgi:hypothetical protein
MKTRSLIRHLFIVLAGAMLVPAVNAADTNVPVETEDYYGYDEEVLSDTQDPAYHDDDRRWDRDRDRRGRRGRGGNFTVSRYPISGQEVIDCQDWRIGGRRGAELAYCVDVGDGRNHGCYAISRTACLAWEGRGNHGSAGCVAYCRGFGRRW